MHVATKILPSVKDSAPSDEKKRPLDGSVGAVASGATTGVAIGAMIGSAGGLPGILLGSAMGGVTGAIAAETAIETVTTKTPLHPQEKDTKK